MAEGAEGSFHPCGYTTESLNEFGILAWVSSLSSTLNNASYSCRSSSLHWCNLGFNTWNFLRTIQELSTSIFALTWNLFDQP